MSCWGLGRIARCREQIITNVRTLSDVWLLSAHKTSLRDARARGRVLLSVSYLVVEQVTYSQDGDQVACELSPHLVYPSFDAYVPSYVRMNSYI